MTAAEAPPPEIGAAGFEAGPTLHFPCFDALRFIGMTMIVVLHTEFATRPWVDENLPGWLQSVFQRMDVGVALFFTISGFLLFRPFMDRELRGRPRGSTRTFLRRRALRIFPGYWFALTVCVVLLGQLLGGAKNALLYYSLLFPFASTDIAVGGGPGQEGDYAIPQAWSLTTELVLYMLLPVLVFVIARWTAGKRPPVYLRHTLVVCAALYVCAQAYRVYFLTAHPSWERVAHIWPPNWLDFFGIGMALAALSVWGHRGNRIPRLLTALGDHPVVSWVVAGAVLFASSTFRAPATPGEYGIEYYVRWLMMGVFCFFMLAPAIFGDQTRGRTRRALASRPVVFLGTISLGVYLFHLALMTNVQDWLAPPGESGAFYGSFPEVFALTFGLSILFAAVSYYVIERPCLRLKDRPLASLVRR